MSNSPAMWEHWPVWALKFGDGWTHDQEWWDDHMSRFGHLYCACEFWRYDQPGLAQARARRLSGRSRNTVRGRYSDDRVVQRPHPRTLALGTVTGVLHFLENFLGLLKDDWDIIGHPPEPTTKATDLREEWEIDH